MMLVRSVVEVTKSSGRASPSAFLAIARKQLQERCWQRKKQENAGFKPADVRPFSNRDISLCTVSMSSDMIVNEAL